VRQVEIAARCCRHWIDQVGGRGKHM
jgi:hypothetical protein